MSAVGCLVRFLQSLYNFNEFIQRMRLRDCDKEIVCLIALFKQRKITPLDRPVNCFADRTNTIKLHKTCFRATQHYISRFCKMSCYVDEEAFVPRSVARGFFVLGTQQTPAIPNQVIGSDDD